MQGFRFILFSSIFGMFLLGQPVVGQTQTQQNDTLTPAIHAIWAKDWSTARALAKQGSSIDPLIIDWLRFRGGDGDAGEILNFLERYSDWPGLSLMRATGEAKLDGVSAQVVVRYFGPEEPQTAQGALALAQALARLKEPRRANAVIQKAWVRMPMSAALQNQIQSQFSAAVAPIHAARLDEMLWQNELENAQRMFDLVSSGDVRLGQARAALRRRADNVDILIQEVPKRLRQNAGLVFDRFLYRYHRRDLRRSAENLLRETSTSAAALGRPEAWAKFRLALGRDALEAGRAKVGYEICANHFISDPADAAKLEWMAGFIGLTGMKNAKAAVGHFTKYLDGVHSDISRARGLYWLGRAQHQARMLDAAQSSWRQAARMQHTFYGQLAAERVGAGFDRSQLAALQSAGVRSNPAIMNSYPFAAGLRLLNDGQHSLAERFLTHVTEGLDEAGQSQLARLALDLKDPHLALRLAKRSSSQGLLLPEAYFPLHPLMGKKFSVPTALVLSIARRESEFDSTAKSSVGALGLMQIMPKTAQHVADRNNFSLGVEPLDQNWRENVKIGALYLDELAREFDSNMILIAVAYNAGPSRARQWIERFGDPRRAGVDPVRWIENIPFEETRNYVKRVIEGVAIYRAKLGGKPNPIPFSKELKARRFF